jgi:NAD(P)-dependent dehydrogenase (short-subunit alcohol dehydrogenase family)
MAEGTKQVAVVTGGASGIGLALAAALGAQAHRILLADLDPGALEDACENLAAQGVEATGRRVDVRDPTSVEALAAQACDLGTLSVVCCNAGVSATGTPVWTTPDSTFDFTFDVNFRGLLNSLRAFVPRLVAQSTPSTIVVTASMAGVVASPGSGAYAASKAAAIALTKSLRGELAAAAPHVSVAVLNPGMVRTNLMRSSATQQPGVMPENVVELTHGSLNERGVEPTEAAAWVFEAIADRRFWVFPRGDDPFNALLVGELEEISASLD